MNATRAAFSALVGLLSMSAGCQMIAAPFLMWGPEPTKSVPAEYPYLTDKRVAVVVWADNYTLLEYPFVRLEISEHIRESLKASVKGIKLVSNQEVIARQDRDSNWDREHPARLGERFKADRVMMVEVSTYSTREADSPHLLRGRISANVKVYDTAYQDAAPAYKSIIDTMYPEGQNAEWTVREDTLRKETMERFATAVANKFYDRKVKVEQ
ncbi:MAG: hypothetical protein ACKVS9_18625 [Phycisphaerae bacterium]